MDVASRGGAKILRTLELAAEYSQERTYSDYSEEPFARPSFSSLPLCKKPWK
jgi:hypothetical protein